MVFDQNKAPARSAGVSPAAASGTQGGRPLQAVTAVEAAIGLI